MNRNITCFLGYSSEVKGIKISFKLLVGLTFVVLLCLRSQPILTFLCKAYKLKQVKYLINLILLLVYSRAFQIRLNSCLLSNLYLRT